MDVYPDFIKTDTEGHDYPVLLGAEKTLNNVIAVKCEANFENSFIIYISPCRTIPCLILLSLL